MSKLRPRAWFLIYRLTGALLGLMPLRFVSRLGDVVGSIIERRASDMRIVVTENLRHVLAADGDDQVLENCVRASFRSYGRYWSEIAYFSRRSSKLRHAVFETVNFEQVQDAHQKGQGVILALPHVGAWDIGGACLARLGMPLTTVGEDATSSSLTAFFVKKRAVLGLNVLPLRADTTRRLLDVLSAGGIVALMSDRDVAGGGVQVEFFGEETTVPAGPAALALRTQSLLVPCAVYQNGRGRYRAVLRPAISTDRSGTFRHDVARVAQSVIGELEVLIRQAPEQWHVFQPNWGADRADVAAESQFE